MKTSEAMGMAWGDKGCVKDTSKCNHPLDDGCAYCCMACNTDSHRCFVCGTVANHKEEDCPEHNCQHTMMAI